MDQSLLDKIVKQVTDELAAEKKASPAAAVSAACAASGMTEFVGTAIGDTIGLVIANVDPSLTETMKLGKYRSIGIIGDRVGAGPQNKAAQASYIVPTLKKWLNITYGNASRTNGLESSSSGTSANLPGLSPVLRYNPYPRQASSKDLL